jgi:hypothetical protein
MWCWVRDSGCLQERIRRLEEMDASHGPLSESPSLDLGDSLSSQSRCVCVRGCGVGECARVHRWVPGTQEWVQCPPPPPLLPFPPLVSPVPVTADQCRRTLCDGSRVRMGQRHTALPCVLGEGGHGMRAFLRVRRTTAAGSGSRVVCLLLPPRTVHVRAAAEESLDGSNVLFSTQQFATREVAHPESPGGGPGSGPRVGRAPADLADHARLRLIFDPILKCYFDPVANKVRCVA